MRRILFVSLPILFLAWFAGCRSSTSVDPPGNYVTPATALDPEPDPEMVRHLLDSGTFHISKAYGKRHRPASFEDSLQSVIDIAVSKVSTDPATHIPYVWGGKHLDAPTEWASCGCLPDSNKHCEARVGLDCSGFVQYVFEQAGFGRQAPELNCQSMGDLKNWSFIADKGYYVFGLVLPNVSELLPGDVLLFRDGSGRLVHTGIFWSHTANINGAIRPAFINSAGYSSCDTCYARENAGQLTGVVASPLGPYWQGKLLMAVRITDWRIEFSALGINFTGGINQNGFGSFVLDTTTGQLEIGGSEDTSYVSSHGFVNFVATGVTDTGVFPIPVVEYGADHDGTFWYSGDDNSYPDSLTFTLTTPPTWWEGAPPDVEPGAVKVSVLSRGQYYGSIMGTFYMKPCAYYSRWEDSTYTIDTTTYTRSVEKFYSKQVEVVGRFSGLLGYR